MIIGEIKEQERLNLIDENIKLHNELFKAREEIKKLQGTVQRLGNKLSKLEKDKEKCCDGGPQWGHSYDCKTLP